MGASPAPSVTSSPAVRQVQRHHWLVRLTHWLTFLVVLGMIASGLQIYAAYAKFGEHGGPYYLNPFEDRAFPALVRLGGWLAGVKVTRGSRFFADAPAAAPRTNNPLKTSSANDSASCAVTSASRTVMRPANLPLISPA